MAKAKYSGFLVGCLKITAKILGGWAVGGVYSVSNDSSKTLKMTRPKFEGQKRDFVVFIKNISPVSFMPFYSCGG